MSNMLIFNIIMAAIFLGILGIPMFIIAMLVKLTSKGPVLHWSDRIGW
jgi:O-antigen biosynthesis protein WbqP